MKRAIAATAVAFLSELAIADANDGVETGSARACIRATWATPGDHK